MNGAIRFLIAWIAFFVIFYALAKSKWGHPIIYYGAWLTVVLMIVLNYKTIVTTLNDTGLSQGSIN